MSEVDTMASGASRLSTVRLSTLVLIVSVLAWHTVQAGPIDHLNRFFNEVKTFQAEFEQVVLDEDLVTIEESSGRMWIARPDRFRWNYAPPLEQQIIGDGKRVWIYDVDLEQITVRDMAATVAGAPAMLLAGTGALESTYRVRSLDQQGDLEWLQLIPREPREANFEDIRLAFESGLLRILELVDGLGQTTRITLRRAEENPKIGKSTFQFTPPAGVDVIDESQG